MYYKLLSYKWGGRAEQHSQLLMPMTRAPSEPLLVAILQPIHAVISIYIYIYI